MVFNWAVHVGIAQGAIGQPPVGTITESNSFVELRDLYAIQGFLIYLCYRFSFLYSGSNIEKGEFYGFRSRFLAACFCRYRIFTSNRLWCTCFWWSFCYCRNGKRPCIIHFIWFCIQIAMCKLSAFIVYVWKKYPTYIHRLRIPLGKAGCYNHAQLILNSILFCAWYKGAHPSRSFM